MKYLQPIIICVAFLFFAAVSFAQNRLPVPIKMLNVEDGLPQSFISGLAQDRTGFIWIGTRDGLAKYDGIKFKVFKHLPGDSTTLANNIISNLYLDNAGYLWIRYESGDIDLLHTDTEILTHLTNDPLFHPLRKGLRDGNSITEDGKGNYWLFGTFERIYICNIKKHTLRSFSHSDWNLKSDGLVGITSSKGKVMMITDTAMVLTDENKSHKVFAKYNFENPHMGAAWKNTPVVIRKSGDIIIKDESRIVIYSPCKALFTTIDLPSRKGDFSFLLACDETDQVYFEHNLNMYILSPENNLSIWKSDAHLKNGYKSILIDRSGVLWLGGNGSGIQTFDLRISRLPAYFYKKSFQSDLLKDIIKVPEDQIRKSFLYGMDPYQLRWKKDNQGRIWFTNGVNSQFSTRDISYLENERLHHTLWRYSDSSVVKNVNVNVLAFSTSGKMWGMDYFLRPVYFDEKKSMMTVYPPIGLVDNLTAHAVSSMYIEGEDDFWITTSQNGLYYYNRKNNRTIQFTVANTKGALPVNQLMNIVPDPKDKDVLWIGSLGSGLIRFNKSKGVFSSYTTRNGLPNNTVYAVLSDDTGTLWCSTNQGIFSFNPNNGELRTFTSRDGLPGNEFNRYHFFQLPNGRFSFGGIDGFTVFDPHNVSIDTFEPEIALTDIHINNSAADFGTPSSPFKQSINSLNEVRLSYRENFFDFSFAALEYNIPEKIQYRYILENYNSDWIYSRSDNVASYTNLPPGKYVFKANATNTAGKWSSHIKSLAIVILPPFWQTWWFISLCIIAVLALAYFLIRIRIQDIIRKEREKSAFERKSAELKAQAMRAQMNPHFIFNCMNSIKALIQEDKRQEAVIYLTTFAKLIRNQLSNAEHEISLHDELETCRLYTQLESLRFGNNIRCSFHIDKETDLHSIKVPPLIIQPFIENAIWHGILPKGHGEVMITVTGNEEAVECRIDDDGIGRERAMRNKSKSSSTYESKGMQLVRGRLSLYNNLNNQDGSIELVDKKDDASNPIGTLVILNFKKQT